MRTLFYKPMKEPIVINMDGSPFVFQRLLDPCVVANHTSKRSNKEVNHNGS